MHRFYIPASDWDASDLRLGEAEAHHCSNVLRMAEGDKVVVFNGRGVEATAVIEESGAKGSLRLRALHSTKTPPLSCRITLGQAVTKGKNMDLIVQKATELGAAEIVPLLSERTIARLDDREDAAAKQAKWQGVVIEAAKQCGQNWLPHVSLPQSLEQFFAGIQNKYELMLVASLQNDARSLRQWLDELSGELPKEVLVLVGPEGDFTPAELGLARGAGCRPMTLGPIVLRTETAAIYCLSVLSYELLVRL